MAGTLISRDPLARAVAARESMLPDLVVASNGDRKHRLFAIMLRRARHVVSVGFLVEFLDAVDAEAHECADVLIELLELGLRRCHVIWIVDQYDLKLAPPDVVHQSTSIRPDGEAGALVLGVYVRGVNDDGLMRGIISVTVDTLDDPACVAASHE